MPDQQPPSTGSKKRAVPENSHWVKSIGKEKFVGLQVRIGCVSAIAVLLLAVTTFWHHRIWLALIPIAVSIAAYPITRHLFYGKIVCPRCGYNPTRRKSDGKPRQDYYKVLAELRRHQSCPNCGQVGPVPVEKSES